MNACRVDDEGEGSDARLLAGGADLHADVPNAAILNWHSDIMRSSDHRGPALDLRDLDTRIVFQPRDDIASAFAASSGFVCNGVGPLGLGTIQTYERRLSGNLQGSGLLTRKAA
jgi:hypothetical protein